MQNNKDDQTQVLDLGLAPPGQGFRMGSPQHVPHSAGAASFDLGSAQSLDAPQLNLSPPHGTPGQGFAQGHSPDHGGSVGSGSAFGDTGQNFPTIGYQNVFTQDVKLVKHNNNPSPLVQVLAALLLVCSMVLAFVWYTTGDVMSVVTNPYELVRLFGFTEDDESLTPDNYNVSSLASGHKAPITRPSSQVPPEPTAGSKPEASLPSSTTQQVTPPTASSSASSGQFSGNKAPVGPSSGSAPSAPQDINIWDSVKNERGSELAPKGASLSTDQEAAFNANLEHEFNYQRYQAVLDLADLKAPGSEELLRQALESKKFWIRMRALIALADLGDHITDVDVKDALGRTHSELRARFFKRFEKSPCSSGCYFVARAALKHLDALGRAQVVRVLAREPSDVRDVFMVAATFDQSQRVRQVAHEWLAKHDIDPAVWREVKSKAAVAH
jgi:hypothetical protein